MGRLASLFEGPSRSYVTNGAVGGVSVNGRANERVLLARAGALGRKIAVVPYLDLGNMHGYEKKGVDVLVVRYGRDGDAVHVLDSEGNAPLVAIMKSARNGKAIDAEAYGAVIAEDREAAWDEWILAEIRNSVFLGTFDEAMAKVGKDPDVELKRLFMESEHSVFDYDAECLPVELVNNISEKVDVETGRTESPCP